MLSAVQFVNKEKVERDIEAETKNRRRERKKEKKVPNLKFLRRTQVVWNQKTQHRRPGLIWDGVSILLSFSGFLSCCAGET